MLKHQAKGLTDVATGIKRALFLAIHAVERMATKRAEFEVDDFLAHRFELHCVGNGEPGCLLLEDGLRLLVKLGAFWNTGDDFGFLYQVFKRLKAELGHIAVIEFCRVAAEQCVEKVVQVTVDTGLAQHAHLVFACLLACACGTRPIQSF